MNEGFSKRGKFHSGVYLEFITKIKVKKCSAIINYFFLNTKMKLIIFTNIKCDAKKSN